jgi:hypothetical protein
VCPGGTRCRQRHDETTSYSLVEMCGRLALRNNQEHRSDRCDSLDTFMQAIKNVIHRKYFGFNRMIEENHACAL